MPDWSHLQAAILDMDGVITDTARVHASAWKQVFDEFLERRAKKAGVRYEPFDRDTDYREYVDGKPRYDGVRSFLQSRGIELPEGHEDDDADAETVCGLGNRKNQVYRKLLQRDGADVYGDAVDMIDKWKRRGWKVAVASSSRNCETVLKVAGLLDRFDARVDGNDIARLDLEGKPAPDMFIRGAELLGVEPSRAVVVEDAISGVQAGRAGNFGLVIGVARRGGGDALRRAGADLVVHDLRELESRPEDPPAGGGPGAALEHVTSIVDRLEGHDLALFLDYDGTLTPIVRRPEDAVLSAEMRSLLRELARHGTVAIVSGRDQKDVERMVQVGDIVYAGSHGFDIHGPNGLGMENEEARRALPALDEAERRLSQGLGRIEGARLERKRFALAVHYREVTNDEDVTRIEKAVDEVRNRLPSLRKMAGKKVFELQPDVEWDKGRAILWLKTALGLDRPDVLTIYIGDDTTDEDAFRVLRPRNDGLGIKVTQPTAETRASYYLQDCGAVERFLRSLLSALQQRSPTEHDAK